MQKWEEISDYTYRMKIYGGWLVMYSKDETAALTFVPDPEYNWK